MSRTFDLWLDLRSPYSFLAKDPAYALEKELGFELFVRGANRFVALTDPGRVALDIARRMLRDAQSLRSLNDAVGREAAGTFRIATTHIHARFALVSVVRQFVAKPVCEHFVGMHFSIEGVRCFREIPDHVASFRALNGDVA